MEFPEKMEVGLADKALDIAIVYSRIPFPMMRGDQLTIAHLIEFLSSRGHRIHFYTSLLDGELTLERDLWLKEKCTSVVIHKFPLINRIINTLFGLIKFHPLQVGMFNNPKLNKEVSISLQNGDFDVLYTYYLRSAEVLEHFFYPNKATTFNNRKTIGVLALQLSQYLNTLRIASQETKIWKKMVYKFEARLIRGYEAKFWKKASKIALIGPRDLLAYKKACDEEKIDHPNNLFFSAHGTNINQFRKAKDDELIKGRIVFSGSMLYQPNIQAILWFTKNCWKAIKDKNPEAQLYIVGRDPVKKILDLHNELDIFVTGTVDDVGSFIRSAEVCINPVLAAGGMQNKLIEYFASNKAVVATSVANEGIKAIPNEMYLEADDPVIFSEKVNEILNDCILRDTLSSSARKFVEVSWTWESHFMRLEKELTWDE